MRKPGLVTLPVLAPMPPRKRKRFSAPWRWVGDRFVRLAPHTRQQMILIVSSALAVIVVLVPTGIFVSSGEGVAIWEAVSRNGLLPGATALPTTVVTPLSSPTNVRPKASGAHAFICALLPWARYVQYLQQIPYSQTPGPHPYLGQSWYLNSQPLRYPWRISVILAQWLVEQGATTPTWVGYNFGNSAGTPGFPAVGGGGVYGAPATFAYGADALDGAEIYEINTRYHFYPAVWQAYARGSIAQAEALGQSPWDFGHYEPNGTYPGYLLVQKIRAFDLDQYDKPYALC